MNQNQPQPESPAQPVQPELHDACGHFHWDHEGGCPESPCGSLLCCIN